MTNKLVDFDLDIPFKGERDYLQSADIYNAVLSKLRSFLGDEALDDVRFLFRHLSKRQLRAFIGSTEEDANVLMTCKIAGEQVRIQLKDTVGGGAERRPYPEEQIVARCRLDIPAESVSYSNGGEGDFSMMEIIVAINKALHLAVLPGPGRKWLFTEIRSSKPLTYSGWKEIRIRIKSRFGTKLTRSTITVDGEEVGYVCFSLKA